jgi:hypothetical protein
MVDLHVFPVLFGIGHFTLADSAGEADQRVSVHVAGVVEGVAVLVFAVITF